MSEESNASEPLQAVENVELTFDEKVKAEMEKAKDMKISELKLKLQARGVLTSTFCEKSEFIRAYAESEVRASEQGNENTGNDDEDEDDDDEEDEDGLPQYMQERVEKLKALHQEREQAMKEYLAERAKLEAKYQAMFQPLYQKRADVVLGKLDDEIAKNKTSAKSGETTVEEAMEKGIPQFWVLVLAHMGVIADLLTEDDIGCLESLEDIKCVDHDNGEGFTLSFYFSENEYFENSVLTKKYDIPNLLTGDEPILKHVEGCEIKWKTGKALTYTEKTQKQRGKGKNSGQVRSVVKKEKQDSFFHFFSPPELPSLDTMNEEEAARLESEYDADYDIAQAFRTKIVPNAVLWYLGEAMEKEIDDAMDGNWAGFAQSSA